MIVIDSSAIAAIAFGEARASELVRCISQQPSDERLMSAANYVEVGTVLAGRRKSDPRLAIVELDELLLTPGIRLAPVSETQALAALDARVRFGRGFGSPAGLNFGDAFACALAKSVDAPLLWVGDDFAATDVKDALRA